MSSILSDCFECKHCHGYNEKKKDISCDAFPNSIPTEILFSDIGAEQHSVCSNGIGFEPIEEPAQQ